MRLSKLLALAILVWGNSVFAKLPNAGSEDLRSQQKVIWYRMALLNQKDPRLNLSAAGLNMNDQMTLLGVSDELVVLEKMLFGGLGGTPGSIKHLVCANPVCDGGGDGGKCHACTASEY